MPEAVITTNTPTRGCVVLCRSHRWCDSGGHEHESSDEDE